MPTLLIRFPGGRYHATPWGHHVNEGLVEWPPSPWRIVRALVATGYTKLGWTEVPPEARALLEALSGTLPTYRLPRATVAHSRHYMPVGVLDKGREKTTLVFDTWAEVQQGTLAVCWNVELSSASEDLLTRLTSEMSYLGRAESWVEAKVVSESTPLPEGSDSFPHDGHARPGQGYEQVPLMAPEPAETYRVWRSAKVVEATGTLGMAGGKKPTATQRKKVEAPYPEDIVECLQKDTGWWKAFRWSQPPGSRKVLYWRSSDSLSVGVPVSTGSRRAVPVGMALLALATEGGRTAGLPSVTRVLPQAELIHRALVAAVGRGQPVDCPELTGRDSDGMPLTGHRHAHVLPVDLDADGRLDHILIHAPMLLGPDAQGAIRGLKRTWTKGGVGELRIGVAGFGETDLLRSLPAPLGAAAGRLLASLGGTRVWRSVTPFVPPRFLKRRGRNTIQGQVLAELASRALPPATVEVLPWTDQTLPMRHMVRVRRSPAAPPPVDVGLALRLTFDEPIRGPLSLGYASHFGLGLFAAEGS